MSSTQNEDELERVFNVIILYAHGEKTHEEAKAALQALLAKAERRAREDEVHKSLGESVGECAYCDGEAYSAYHDTRWMTLRLLTIHQKTQRRRVMATDEQDEELLMVLEKYKEDIKFLHHQIRGQELTPDEILAKEDTETNKAKAALLAWRDQHTKEAVEGSALRARKAALDEVDNMITSAIVEDKDNAQIVADIHTYLGKELFELSAGEQKRGGE